MCLFNARVHNLFIIVTPENNLMDFSYTLLKNMKL